MFYRLAKVILILIRFLLVGVIAELFDFVLFKSPSSRQRDRSRRVAWASREVLKTIGFKVMVRGHASLSSGAENYLIVANHLSFWDILVLAAHFDRLIFTTSNEVRRTPVLSWFAKLGGSYFVERRHRQTLMDDIDGIGALLKEGLNVVVFPEGTSSPGDSVLRFKSSLFKVAEVNHTQTLPICINYRQIENEQIKPHNREAILYCGDLGFYSQFLRTLRLKSVSVDLEVLYPVSPRPYKEICGLAYSSIYNAFDPILEQPG